MIVNKHKTFGPNNTYTNISEAITYTLQDIGSNIVLRIDVLIINKN